ncbi:MAG: glycosyltransferase [Candidatus Baltobacteraceae bacterium]
MRAGFFTEVYRPVVNGVVASIDALAAGLRELGHEVSVFAPGAPGSDRDEPPVFRIPSLPLPIASPYRLTVPHVRRGPRHAVIDHLQIVHAHSPFVTGWMAARIARRLRVPLIYTYHTRLEEYAHYVPFEANATKRAAEALTRTYANTADAVVVPTHAMQERLLELGVEVPIEIVPSGIDLELFGGGRRSDALRTRLGVKPGQRLLFTVSRLAREKNIDLLLHALARTRVPALLAIAGEGPYEPDLRALVQSLGLQDRVVFIGPVQREELPHYYASADAFVFASVTETQGMVLAEALAAGASVIAADVPQVRDVLGGAGAVAAPDASAFALAFEAIPRGRSAGGAALAQSGARRFGHLEQARKVEALYDQLTRTYVRYTIKP